MNFRGKTNDISKQLRNGQFMSEMRRFILKITVSI